jgi:hypothetical protein
MSLAERASMAKSVGPFGYGTLDTVDHVPVTSVARTIGAEMRAAAADQAMARTRSIDIETTLFIATSLMI